MRVIDETGQNIGVLQKDEALKYALERNLDLIEVSPNANPPIAKIISFDKFRYQQDKEAKRQAAQANKSAGDFKQIRITARAAENDLRIKVKQLEEFIKENSKVEICLVLRGREKGKREWAEERLKAFLSMIEVPYTITMPHRMGGKGIIMQIIKKSTK